MSVPESEVPLRLAAKVPREASEMISARTLASVP